jgi:hypothetical protein
LVETRRWVDASERAAAQEQCRYLTEQIGVLDAEQTKRQWGFGKLTELVKAAEFVTDTDGDKTAIEQLRGISAIARSYIEAANEMRELKHERETIRWKCYSKRWEIVKLYDIGGIAASESMTAGDSLDELMSAIESAPATV